MPTVLRSGRYRIFFSAMIGPRELRSVERLVVENESELLRAWNDYFGP